MATELTEPTESAPKSLPVWLSIPIILLCLGAGGYIVHWYVMTDPISHESKILGDPVQAVYPGAGRRMPQGGPGGGFNGPGGQQRNRPGPQQSRRIVLFDQNTGDVQIRTEKANARVTVVKGKATIKFAVYRDISFLPPDALKTIEMARALHQNQAEMETLKLDTRQQNKLGGLSNAVNPPMVMSAADKESLSAAALGYVTNTAQRATLEPELLQLLEDISDRSKDATKQQLIDRVAQINQIVTPDMWKQFAAAGGK